MGITNELYVISNTARGEIGFLFLGFAIIIVFYSIFSVEYKRRRLEKLKEAAGSFSGEYRALGEKIKKLCAGVTV